MSNLLTGTMSSRTLPERAGNSRLLKTPGALSLATKLPYFWYNGADNRSRKNPDSETNARKCDSNFTAPPTHPPTHPP